MVSYILEVLSIKKGYIMSRNLQRRLIICTCVFACYAGNVFSGEIGTTGILEQAPTEMDLCPTFSWSGNPAATDYELAVFEDSGDGSMNYEEMAELSDPVISTIIQAPALSWTPAGDNCLEEDLSYAWFIRDLSSEGEGVWSMAIRAIPEPLLVPRRINVVGELRTTAPAANCVASPVNCRGSFRHVGSGGDGQSGLFINSHTGGSWADIVFQTDEITRMLIHKEGKIDVLSRVTIKPDGGTLGSSNTLLHVISGTSDNSDSQTLMLLEYGIFNPPALKVRGDGTVGINTANPNNAYKLHVAGPALATAWQTGSSREYKKDIRKVPAYEHKQMLERLMSMDLSTYQYKQAFGGDGDTKLGFIAEEMPGEVLSRDGKAVDLYALLSYTIGAIQEQQREIIEVAALKAENKTLRAQTEGLRQLVCQDHPQADICR